MNAKQLALNPENVEFKLTQEEQNLIIAIETYKAKKTADYMLDEVALKEIGLSQSEIKFLCIVAEGEEFGRRAIWDSCKSLGFKETEDNLTYLMSEVDELPRSASGKITEKSFMDGVHKSYGQPRTKKDVTFSLPMVLDREKYQDSSIVNYTLFKILDKISKWGIEFCKEHDIEYLDDFNTPLKEYNFNEEEKQEQEVKNASNEFHVPYPEELPVEQEKRFPTSEIKQNEQNSGSASEKQIRYLHYLKNLNLNAEHKQWLDKNINTLDKKQATATIGILLSSPQDFKAVFEDVLAGEF